MERITLKDIAGYETEKKEALKIIAKAYAIAMGEDPKTTADYIIAHRWKKHIKQGITNL